ncbi:MAG: hypothetical protein QXL94_08550, partial [Candidatus Parvarchaeum sp.]
MDEVANDVNDKSVKEENNTEKDKESASVNTDKDKKDENDKNNNVLPSDDSIPNNTGNEIKMNKYLLIAVIVIIVLLVIAYFLYHYNILGVRLFVRHTLGLSTSGLTANSALDTLISNNFAGVNHISLTSSIASKEGLNSTYFESYALFGTGNAAAALENGSSPNGLNGLVILLGVLKNNESLSYYYHALSNYKNLSNITLGGIPAIEAIENTTPPANSSLLEEYGAFNVTSYKCNSSGFNAVLINKLNQTVKIVNASIYSIANLTQPNSSIFNSSIKAIKPNETVDILFPEEKCNPGPYETDFTVGTNYSISQLAGFVSFIKFSPYLVK